MDYQSGGKAKRALQQLLTSIVIIAQLTLPLGALMAAVQPTPQLAAAVARQAGLGDWIAQRTGGLVAWVQPLWGQPKTAAAQATNSIWGIKNYTNFGYLNTTASPWTWVTVTTLSGGNYNAAAAITRTQGIVFGS